MKIDLELGDVVEIHPGVHGGGPALPRECRKGVVVYLGDTADRVYETMNLCGRDHWLSALDIRDFGMAALGRHLPATVDGHTKRPLPRFYGPVIVRVDLAHKVTGKPRKPIFVHVFPSQVRTLERPVRPALKAEEVAKALIESPAVGELVFDALREDIHSDLFSDQWDSHVLELKLDADEEAAQVDGGVSARELLRVLREFPRFCKDVFWLMEHGHRWMPDPSVSVPTA